MMRMYKNGRNGGRKRKVLEGKGEYWKEGRQESTEGRKCKRESEGGTVGRNSGEGR